MDLTQEWQKGMGEGGFLCNLLRGECKRNKIDYQLSQSWMVAHGKIVSHCTFDIGVVQNNNNNNNNDSKISKMQ